MDKGGMGEGAQAFRLTGKLRQEYRQFERKERIKDFQYFFTQFSAKAYPGWDTDKPFTKAQYAVALEMRDRDDLLVKVQEELTDAGTIPDTSRQDVAEILEDLKWFESQGWLASVDNDSYSLTPEGKRILSGAASARLN